MYDSNKEMASIGRQYAPTESAEGKISKLNSKTSNIKIKAKNFTYLFPKRDNMPNKLEVTKQG